MEKEIKNGRNGKPEYIDWVSVKLINLKNRTIFFFLALIYAGFMHSCREECTYKPRSLAGVSFHSVVEGTEQQSPVDSLSVMGLGRDSLLYDVRNSAGSVVLPINGSDIETAFIFKFDRGTDTLWLNYEVNPVFLSPECGFILNFELLEANHTENVIDSVVIVTSEITSFDDTNIRIYH